MVGVTFWSSGTLFQTRWVYDTDFWLKDLLWLLMLTRDFFCFCFFTQFISICLTKVSLLVMIWIRPDIFYDSLSSWVDFINISEKNACRKTHLLGRDFFLIFHSVYTLYHLITVKNVCKCFLQILQLELYYHFITFRIPVLT